jgi:hypothetical protein
VTDPAAEAQRQRWIEAVVEVHGDPAADVPLRGR